MKSSPTHKKPGSILGLSLEKQRIEGVVLKRTNGSAITTGNLAAALNIDPLGGDPELVGREIRQHLDTAGIREKKCVVALPLSWLLVQNTQAPDLPTEDFESLLQMEAERGFPYNPDALILDRSITPLGDGQNHILQVAVPREQVLQLEKALRHANLDPLSFSVGLPAMSPLDSNQDGCIELALHGHQVDLQVRIGSSLLALRSLDQGTDENGSALIPDAAALLRELRITLGAWPDSIRRQIRSIRVLGGGDRGHQLASQLKPRAASLGIQDVQHAPDLAPQGFSFTLPSHLPASPALGLAARHLDQHAPTLEFLPPKVTFWQEFSQRYSSAKLFYGACAAGIVIACLLAAFLYQQIQLGSLRSEWASMNKSVMELEDIQLQIKKYRPWFDENHTSLRILRRMTECFPEENSVTAKNIEIRESSTVTCSGTARDIPTLMKTLDQLRASPDIADIKSDQLRGKSPTQFTFQFLWGTRSSNTGQP